MDWQDKYLCPNIESDKFSLNKLKEAAVNFWVLFKHSISYHKSPKEPFEELPQFKSVDENTIHMFCNNLYQSANDRIDKLEDKALKLLSYVTALFAFISFAFLNTSYTFTKILLLVSMIFLLFAILISFRCVNVKGRKVSFLPDVYNFNVDPPVDNFNKKNISKKLLNSAIYNQNIADNVADILKTARYMLTLALIISVVGFLIGINGYFNSTNKSNIVKIENQIELSEIERAIDNTNNKLEIISDDINKLDNSKTQDIQTHDIYRILKSVQSDYNILMKRIEALETQVKENNIP